MIIRLRLKQNEYRLLMEKFWKEKEWKVNDCVMDTQAIRKPECLSLELDHKIWGF